MSSNIRIRTEKFRAINSADIQIDGITLVAGENGCGKSTISKLLHYLFKTISNYDILVKQKLNKDLRDKGYLISSETNYRKFYLHPELESIRENFVNKKFKNYFITFEK